jgi:hypothetical protein
MDGSWQLNPNPGATSTISVSGVITDGQGGTCNTGPLATAGGPRGVLTAGPQPVRNCGVMAGPLWSRTANYTITWNNAAVGSRIVLGSGAGYNPWGVVPEPGTLLLVATGIGILRLKAKQLL